MTSRPPTAIKRTGYVLGLAVAVVAIVCGLLLEAADGHVDPVDLYGLPATASALLFLMVAFLRERAPTARLEVATFVTLATFFLLQLAAALYLPSSDGQTVSDELTQFGVWFPTLYAATLFLLGVERGWRISLGHFGLSVAVAVPYLIEQLASGESFLAVYALSQLYLSSAVLIITAVAFARYTEGMARAKARAEDLAHTDYVTSLGNRRHMEQLLDQEVRRTERYGHELAILLLDIDHFKRVNDRHGHAAGDAVLKKIAELLRSEARSTDFVGRWGGEEFLLILPDTGSEVLKRVADRIAGRLASYAFTGVGPITASLGGAVLRLGERRSDVVRRADAALYRAKDEGRNRVVIASEEEGEAAPARSAG